jgi:HK97 family phage prohead protease
MKNKRVKKLAYAKSVDGEKFTISGYASTYQWDRDGEKFVRGAWDLNEYKKNPVVLWAHNPAELPIGKAIAIEEDDYGLKVTVEFNQADEKSMSVFELIKNGFLNAFSVGFIRRDYRMEDTGDGSGQKGLAITKAELYEFSVVSVPANPGALISRDVAELAMKTLGPGAVEEISHKGLDTQFVVLPLSTPDQYRPAVPETKGFTPPAAAAAPAPAIEDFEPALKRVIELAKVAKGKPVDETKRSLLLTASQVFQEMLEAKSAELTGEDLDALKGVLGDFASVVKRINPDAAEAVNKTISQIEKALTGPAA